MVRLILIITLFLAGLPVLAQYMPVPERGKPSAGPKREKTFAPWQPRDYQTLKEAANWGRPIVLLFTTDKGHDFADGDEMREVAEKIAVFVMAMDRDGRSPAAADEISPPDSKFLADKVTAAYSARADREQVLVCDWFGNEHYRTDTRVKADKLKEMIDSIPKRVEDFESKLGKRVAKARAALTTQDLKECLKQIRRAFNEGCWGYRATKDAEQLFNKLRYHARREMKRLYAVVDVDGLRKLHETFQKTDLRELLEETLTRAARIAASPEEEEEF